MALESTGLLNQEEKTEGTALAFSCNGFNKLIRLEMMCTVRNHWSSGARFMFNLFKHWVQLILCQSGISSVTLLNLERVTHVDPLLMVIYGITLVPLEEYLRAADPGLVSPFYVENATFNRLAIQS